MKKIIMGCTVMAAIALMSTACSNQNKTAKEVDTTAVEETITEQEQQSLKKMTEQGNPLEVNLAEIAEENDGEYKAWLKISTVYDELLSMYNSDSVPAGTTAIVVDMEISGMDISETTLCWCYELTTGENLISVWDDSSASDKLTVKEDGRYRMVFDAKKALGGTIDKIGSLQIVFPGFDETTGTKVKVISAGYLGGDADISDYVTGKLE
ncbi:MAG: hypothetical protein PUB17_06725 [Lachnospiraceae bacterium]|nr:hypothetical protein [Lachnospiraceae bacterium]